MSPRCMSAPHAEECFPLRRGGTSGRLSVTLHLVAVAGTGLARLEKLGVKTSARHEIIAFDGAARDLR